MTFELVTVLSAKTPPACEVEAPDGWGCYRLRAYWSGGVLCYKGRIPVGAETLVLSALLALEFSSDGAMFWVCSLTKAVTASLTAFMLSLVIVYLSTGVCFPSLPVGRPGGGVPDNAMVALF